MKRLTLTATTLALLAAPVLANGSETFRAQGNEPSWSIRMSDGAMTFQPMDGEAVTVKPIPTPRQDGTTDIYEAKGGAPGMRELLSGAGPLGGAGPGDAGALTAGARCSGRPRTCAPTWKR